MHGRDKGEHWRQRRGLVQIAKPLFPALSNVAFVKPSRKLKPFDKLEIRPLGANSRVEPPPAPRDAGDRPVDQAAYVARQPISSLPVDERDLGDGSQERKDHH